MNDMPHQIITRALSGFVSVQVIRDWADGTALYAVSYVSGATGQADAGAIVLADFLGAQVRL
jgi:hypothetical protein